MRATGRPSVPPERLWRVLLKVLYALRSERQLMEQLDYGLLFRWFMGLGIDDPVLDRTVFCIDPDRLLSETCAARFLRAGAGDCRKARLGVGRVFPRGRQPDRGVGLPIRTSCGRTAVVVLSNPEMSLKQGCE